MAREWKEVIREDNGRGGSVVLLFWAALFTLSIITVIVFSCAGGASKDKDSAGTDAYGTTCAAGCGAACGG
ncbi:hypothetical protein Dsin_028907 [Dipteronia sinensis]|uniref:Uncharacterized protein n=1 Tax=Dipteronia sinensis TaxID=43782 RepID=A0AAD9ZSY3_9ROSI|nr:hypothetical protein Dsin_028907 [Dipteronia sinensis]